MSYTKCQWTEMEKLAVWNKGKIILGYDPNIYRQDIAGAWMQYSNYGTNDNDLSTGWEIDHIHPEAKGGSSSLGNLEPLQWNNNRTKSDDYPSFYTSISSSGANNIRKMQKFN